jgi:hypothetical protein
MEQVSNNEAVEREEDQAVEVVEEKTIHLRKPVTIGKNPTPYSELALREPTAGELEKASKASTDIGVVLNLISLVAKVPRAVAEGLCQRDLKEASDFLGSFNDDAPATGAMSSPS